jgi:hypothetical protein
MNRWSWTEILTCESALRKSWDDNRNTLESNRLTTFWIRLGDPAIEACGHFLPESSTEEKTRFWQITQLVSWFYGRTLPTELNWKVHGITRPRLASVNSGTNHQLVRRSASHPSWRHQILEIKQLPPGSNSSEVLSSKQLRFTSYIYTAGRFRIPRSSELYWSFDMVCNVLISWFGVRDLTIDVFPFWDSHWKPLFRFSQLLSVRQPSFRRENCTATAPS